MLLQWPWDGRSPDMVGRACPQRAEAAAKVTQNGILLYRGLGIRLAWGKTGRWGALERSAECNSAIQQIENLRIGAGTTVCRTAQEINRARPFLRGQARKMDVG